MTYLQSQAIKRTLFARFHLAMVGVVGAMLLFLLLPHTVSAAGLSKPANNLGLVGYWKFDEGTSTKATDFSGKGNLGAFPGGSANPTWTSGKLGAALSFDGGDYVNMGSALTLRLTGTITVSAWIKPSSVTADQKIVSNDNSSNGGYKFGLFTNSKVEFEIKSSGNGATTNRAVGGGTVLQAGVWYHVVGVYSDSGDYIKTYVNGVLDRTNSSATGVLAAPASGTFGIGYGPGEGYYFNGLMDEVRVYSRVLSDAEIAALYNSGSAKFGSSKALTAGTTLTNGLVGHWTFDGKDMYQNVADASGNANVGRLVGFAATTTSPGKLGQSLKFDDVDDYVLLNGLNIGNNSDFTFCEWMKPSAWLGTNPGFWRSDVSSGGGYFNIFQGSTGRPWIRWNTVNILQPGSGYAVSLNVWTHVCYVIRSAVDAQFYANGELQHSASHSTATTAFTIYNLGWQSSINERITGLHDDVRVYNRALTAAEVKQLYNLGGAKFNTSSVTTQGSGLSSGLVGHWTFDGADTQSTIADKSGQNNYGYFYGGATSSAKTIGKLGQALKFDGVDDYIKTSLNPGSSGTLSFSFWIYNSSFKANSTILGQGVAGSDGAYFIRIGNTSSLFDVTFGGFTNGVNAVRDVNLSSTLGVTENKWYHMAVTFDGVTCLIYVNGVQKNSQTLSAPILPWTSGVGIGVRGGGSLSSYWNGSIDDMRVYERALSASEVKQLYLMGK